MESNELEFKCPICGGRLLLCCYETGTTDYIVNRKGKVHKNPIRKASRNCDRIDAQMICCENAFNRNCDFYTNCDFEFSENIKYEDLYKIILTDDGFKLYSLGGLYRL